MSNSSKQCPNTFF